MENSPIFGKVYRLVALMCFWSKKIEGWVEILGIVDTGADYTLLPCHMAKNLGVNFKKDCQKFATTGIGGTQNVYLVRYWKVKLGKWEKTIPVGFLDSDTIPPLLGRQEFLEDFQIVFENHAVNFNQPRK